MATAPVGTQPAHTLPLRLVALCAAGPDPLSLRSLKVVRPIPNSASLRVGPRSQHSVLREPHGH